MRTPTGFVLQPLRLALVASTVAVGLSAWAVAAGRGVAEVLMLAATAMAMVGVLAALRARQTVAAEEVERARAAAALRASEATFSGILAIAADAIISIDERHRIVHFNHGAEEIFRTTADAMVGQSLQQLIPERFRATHPALIDGFARSGSPARRMGQRREIFGLRCDGTEFPAEASISQLALEDGRRLFTVVLRDITDRKAIEDDERYLAEIGTELAASIEYDAVLQMIADVAVPRLADACLLDVVDGEGLRRVLSRGAPEPLRRLAEAHPLTMDSPSPVIDVLRRVAPVHVPAVDTNWLEAHEEDAPAVALWQSAGAVALLILPLASAGRRLGALTLVSCTAGRTFDAATRSMADKVVTRAALALENARLYETARQARLARDEVVRVVSHDLRNPLSAIAMCARALRNAPPAEEGARRDLLETIDQSTEWINRLIQDLVDVASIEQGQLAIERRPESIGTIVQAAVHLFEIEARQHGIRLSVSLPEASPVVAVDAGRIVQVLSNLIRNAIKFTPDGGAVAVEVRLEPPAVLIAVRDTGQGIPQTSLPRVFDRYWHNAAGARRKGSGLGLSIARGLVEAHSGHLRAESTLGQGSIFTVSLPMDSASGEP